MNANTTINARNIDISADAKVRLESAVEYIREQYPDVDIKAEYRDFKDLKVKWVRTYKWIEFDVVILTPDWTEEDIEDMTEKYLDLRRRFEE